MTAANKRGWSAWCGGPCPVSPEQTVEVGFRDKTSSLPVPASDLDWTRNDEGTDIIKYRRCDPAKAIA